MKRKKVEFLARKSVKTQAVFGEKMGKMKQKYVKNAQKGGLLPHCHFVVITRMQFIINDIKAKWQQNNKFSKKYRGGSVSLKEKTDNVDGNLQTASSKALQRACNSITEPL